MARMIFVNLPVSDIVQATAFYEGIGATRNPMFSNAETSCMVVSDTIHIMLLNHAAFARFTSKAIVDAGSAVEVLNALSEDSRAEVDTVIARAVAAGGREDEAARQDFGFMYGRRFEDPDGHSWDVIWMDVAAFADAMAENSAA